MIVRTRIVFDKNGSIVAENTRLHMGRILFCKGASTEQTDLEKSQAALTTTLTNAYNTQFANQQAIFAAVKAVYDPIFNAGPSQYGFAPAEDRTLRTQASEGTSATYNQALKGVSERMAAAGGGNSFLPSGVAESIKANIAGSAAAQESNQQLGITKAGYDVGRENFDKASAAEFGVASGENPLGYAGAATSSNTAAFNEATKIQEENAASNPWGVVGGLLGGAAGAFLGPAGASFGSKLGGFLGNAGSGNAGPSSFPTPDYSTISLGN